MTELAPAVPQADLLLAPRSEADRLVARAAMLPAPAATDLAVLAQSGDGRTLARATAHVPAGATEAELPIVLPPELRNRLTRLVLEGPASAGATLLLDEGLRRRPVGLVTADAGADTPLVGALYYLEGAGTRSPSCGAATCTRCCSGRSRSSCWPTGRWRRRRRPSCAPGSSMAACCCASPGRAAPTRDDGHPAADPLMPERLLAEDRQLGGALSWSQPAKLAPFPATVAVRRAGGAGRRDGEPAGAGGAEARSWRTTPGPGWRTARRW